MEEPAAIITLSPFGKLATVIFDAPLSTFLKLCEHTSLILTGDNCAIFELKHKRGFENISSVKKRKLRSSV